METIKINGYNSKEEIIDYFFISADSLDEAEGLLDDDEVNEFLCILCGTIYVNASTFKIEDERGCTKEEDKLFIPRSILARL
jgi:hypothetical protein